MWKFAESTPDRLNSILPITEAVEITSALKFEDCNCRKRKIN
jgi:hypothetical protein